MKRITFKNAVHIKHNWLLGKNTVLISKGKIFYKTKNAVRIQILVQNEAVT